MKEVLAQIFQNLRAHKLRSFLTMFGILWGIVAIVVLSAMGEGFRQGNEKVLRELGRDISIVFGGTTSLQAGGERAGRRVLLTVDDARAIARESSLAAAVSPELQRGGVRVKSRYNAASVGVHGIEPPYQEVRTIAVQQGRLFNWEDERHVRRVAIVGFDIAKQLFDDRDPIGETLTLNGMPYVVVGRIRKKNQDSNYSGPDNDKIFIPFAAMRRDLPRPNTDPGTVSNIIVAATPEATAMLPVFLAPRIGKMKMRDIDFPMETEIRRILARRKGFDPDDREAIGVWDTSVNSLMFGRMVDGMRRFFTIVGLVTLALGGIGVMNIMLIAVKERTKEIGVRKALGATTSRIQRQFFLEGFFLTLVSGGLGMLAAVGLCQLVNLAPLPPRFAGMLITWQLALMSIAVLVCVGVATSTYPARRAASLPPVEALRYEM
jgi:putative ABC transport system permease protein